MMESQLAEYRKQKAKDKTSEATWLSHIGFHRRKTQPSSSTVNVEQREKENQGLPEQEDQQQSEVVEEADHVTHGKFDQSYLTTENLLKVLLWLMLLGAFVFLGLGGVFLLASVCFAVYLSMDSRRSRKNGELSAYSVFNPNCERLQGQLTAEQFERELKYGAGGM